MADDDDDDDVDDDGSWRWLMMNDALTDWLDWIGLGLT